MLGFVAGVANAIICSRCGVILLTDETDAHSFLSHPSLSPIFHTPSFQKQHTAKNKKGSAKRAQNMAAEELGSGLLGQADIRKSFNFVEVTNLLDEKDNLKFSPDHLPLFHVSSIVVHTNLKRDGSCVCTCVSSKLSIQFRGGQRPYQIEFITQQQKTTFRRLMLAFMVQTRMSESKIKLRIDYTRPQSKLNAHEHQVNVQVQVPTRDGRKVSTLLKTLDCQARL